MTRADRWLRALLGAATLIGCVTDHDALEKKPGTGSGAGGAPSSAGAPAQAGGAGAPEASGGGHADDEAPGTSVFTVINGLVDAPSVVLCWAKFDDAGSVTPFGNPLGGAPLAYGQSLVLAKIDGADVASETLQPIAIAGELDLIAGLDCAAAVTRAHDEEAAAIDGDAGTANMADAGEVSDGGDDIAGLRPRLRARGLPAISAGTLSAGFSLLYVSTGCMGGATFTGKNATEYCGAGYTERAATASAVLVSLSRKTQPKLTGLQVVHASLATTEVDVSSRPPLSTGAGVVIASNVVEGQAAPRPALLSNAAVTYGVAKGYFVQVAPHSGVGASFDWSKALQGGGLTELTDGRTYALVLLGPRADHTEGTSLWNGSALTAITVDGNAN
jgi:hypothetical protein